MPRFLPVVVFAAWSVVGPFSTPASAVSVDELFNLRANGLSDDILVALIEADGSVFELSADDVLMLHKKGMGEKVILAMLATARRAHQAAEHQATFEAAEAAVPITVQTTPPSAPIQQSVVQHVEVLREEPVYVQVPVAFPVAVPVPVRHEKPVKPVYWGFGGTLRPDSWRPAPDRDVKPPDRDTVRPPR
jgi:hypothetical protein